ncbi:MAG: phosphatase PAP2 family protein [Halieaceae bacterium]|nr:MAG: phosphatase PAP2 family protein [Halieaceae bacterium]
MRKPFSVALVLGTLAACQPQAPSLDIFAPVPELGHQLMQGYLHGEPPLDSAAFVPPPPSEGSARQEADDAASEALRRLEGSARWDQATMDADLHFPAATSIFACALGTTISEAQTPALYRLLKRSLTDLGLATYPAKKAHQRPRPFLINGGAICTPEERELLETDGSYPSGHSAIGWGWALILSQLAPERAEALLSRGRDYARSRMVCNVHWMSDTEAGMAVGAAAFARLQNNELFQATMAAARAELSSAAGSAPDADACEQEAATLALSD